MQAVNPSTTRKALTINLDDSKYGSFAEIGAGQEVARYFFQAGRASHTIAKSMSAYDKVFSDEIYGRGSRFVSQDRLTKMLAHEYELLEARLGETRGDRSSFFAFANTVATSSHEDNPSCHGWMGVVFQMHPEGPINKVSLHVRMLDRMRLQQSEALGILGVNLLFSCFYLTDLTEDFIASLTENISDDRVDIDFIEFSGEDLGHIDNRLTALELVKKDMTRAALFSPEGKVLQAADHLYKKHLVIQRGTFRPITQVNQDILSAGLAQLSRKSKGNIPDQLSLMEITMSNLLDGDEINRQDFLDRVDTLCSLGHHVLVSNYPLYYQLKTYLRRCTDGHIVLLAGAKSLENLFKDQYYTHLEGGTLEAFGRLFDENTELLIYPYKTNDSSITAENFNTPDNLRLLFSHLKSQKKIMDLIGCENLTSYISPSHLQQMIRSGDPQWEQYVPGSVVQLIKERKLFNWQEKSK